MPDQPTALRVPKSLTAEEVAWAFRYGIACAMMRRGRTGPIVRLGGAYQIHFRNVLQLAGRVEREWNRRHPKPQEARS